MSNSPLVTNITNAVNSALASKGVPLMYPPDLNYIIIQVLTEMSGDSLVSATDQATYAAQIALAATDASP